MGGELEGVKVLTVDTCGNGGVFVSEVELAVGDSKVGSKPKVIEGRPVLLLLEDEVDLMAMALVVKVLEVLVEAVLVPFDTIVLDTEDAEDAAEWLQSSLIPPIKVILAGEGVFSDFFR